VSSREATSTRFPLDKLAVRSIDGDVVSIDIRGVLIFDVIDARYRSTT
jgi:hypothetical protein